jgi:hypothetical protein
LVCRNVARRLRMMSCSALLAELAAAAAAAVVVVVVVVVAPTALLLFFCRGRKLEHNLNFIFGKVAHG